MTTTIWIAHWVEIYLFYGLSFILLGAAALLQPSDPQDQPISQHFWLLGFFGLLHGGKEIFEAWVIATDPAGAAMGWAGSSLLMVSYVPLFELPARLMPCRDGGVGEIDRGFAMLHRGKRDSRLEQGFYYPCFPGRERSRVIAHLLGRISGALDIGGQDPDRTEFSVMTRAWK